MSFWKSAACSSIVGQSETHIAVIPSTPIDHPINARLRSCSVFKRMSGRI